jgi:hypothetical protein
VRVRRLRVVVLGLVVSLDGFLENSLIELRFDQHFLEATVLDFKLFKTLGFVGLHASELFLPTHPSRLLDLLLLQNFLPKSCPLKAWLLLPAAASRSVQAFVFVASSSESPSTTIGQLTLITTGSEFGEHAKPFGLVPKRLILGNCFRTVQKVRLYR